MSTDDNVEQAGTGDAGKPTSSKPDAGQDGDKGKDSKDSKDGKDGKDGDKKDDKPSPLQNPKVKFGLIIAVLLLLVAGALWFYHYWTRGRYEQSTNDAYLQADQVSIAPKVGGYVDQVLVADNQQVSVGQPLVRIDRRDSDASIDKARAQVAQGEAAVAQAEAQIHQQQAQIAVADAQLAGARRSAHYAHVEADRYAPLAQRGAQSAEQLDQMNQRRDEADSQVAMDRAQRDSAVRQIGVLQAQIGSAKAQIAQAQAQQRQAATDLDATLVRSSIAGRVGDRTVRVGQYVQPGTRLMSVVPLADIYLVANFKETQLGLMRVGQPATIKVDAISGGEFAGHVDSFAPGTGSQFAILPPQNATGNFTKVVQRVPVRIRIEASAEERKVLVPGLSVTAVVDTIGAKPEKDQIKDDARRTEDAGEREHDAAVRRERGTAPAGAGQ